MAENTYTTTQVRTQAAKHFLRPTEPTRCNCRTEVGGAAGFSKHFTQVLQRAYASQNRRAAQVAAAQERVREELAEHHRTIEVISVIAKVIEDAKGRVYRDDELLGPLEQWERELLGIEEDGTPAPSAVAADVVRELRDRGWISLEGDA